MDNRLFIVLFSGGLDSTYLLWKYLSEGKRVHAHHVFICNKAEPDLWKFQKDAVNKIVLSLKKDFRFSFTKSKHEWYCYRKIGWDTDILLLHAQRLCINLCQFPLQVCLGWVKDDSERLIVRRRWENNVSGKLWIALRNSLTTITDNIPENLSYPLLDRGLYKHDLLSELPKQLINLTWSCRKPKENKTCGSCVPCRQLGRIKNG